MKSPAPPPLGEPQARANGSDRVERGRGRDDGHLVYHGYYGAHSPDVSGPNNEEQPVGLYHPSEGERSERTHQESSYEEAVAPRTPSSSAKEKQFPNKFSLTQTLLSMVVKRLERYRMHVDHKEDYPGTASLLESPAISPASSLTQSTEVPRGGLKTTGLEESDYSSDVEAGAYSTEDTEEMTKYLPRSAALLVSALQSCTKKTRKGSSLGPSESVEDFLAERSRAGTWDLEGCEKTAEALLESICRDEVDGRGGDAVREPAPRHGCDPDVVREPSLSRMYEGPPEGAVGLDTRASFNAGANAASAVDMGEDDDDSIGGDAARLRASVASIRRDLLRVDISHLEEFGGGGGGADGYAGGDGLVARFKLWVSRGLIMEQKLLHTYVSPDGANDGEDGTATSVRYVDNPVLLWSLALMWSFVVLILLHPKIAALVEGGDEGQMADILQWLFGKDEVSWA